MVGIRGRVIGDATLLFDAGKFEAVSDDVGSGHDRDAGIRTRFRQRLLAGGLAGSSATAARSGSNGAGLDQVIGESVDHGHEPSPGGHQRMEHAFLDCPLGAYRTYAGGDHPVVECPA